MTGSPEPAPATPQKAGRNLPVAIAVGLALLIAVAVGLIWAHWFFVLLVAVGLCLAVIEMHRALKLKGMRSSVVPIVVGTAVSVVGAWVVSRFDLGSPTGFALACIAATMAAAFCAHLFHGTVDFVKNMAASAFIIAYLPFMGMFLTLILADSNGSLRFLVIILCAVASDLFAYVVGSLFGRNKMAPTISPGKTWEGLAGGVVCTAVTGICFGMWLLGISWWVGLILGVLVSLAATVGDLAESAIKRDVGIKDMSNFLPGHGGILDRIDSMLIAVPLGWAILYLAMGP